MAKYRINFTDSIGQGTIECDTLEERNEVMKNLQESPDVDEIWEEYYDEEEGWQA